jgi:hypothetical protein
MFATMTVQSMVPTLKRNLSPHQHVLQCFELPFIPVEELVSTLDTLALRTLSIELSASVEDANHYASGALLKAIITIFIVFAIDEEDTIFIFLNNGWSEVNLLITPETPLVSLPLKALSAWLRESPKDPVVLLIPRIQQP